MRRSWDPFSDIDRMMWQMQRDLMQDFFPTRTHPADSVRRGPTQEQLQSKALESKGEKGENAAASESTTAENKERGATAVQERPQDQDRDFATDLWSLDAPGWPLSMSRALRSAPRAPPLEIEETDNEYKVHMTVPGYNKDQIKVTVTGSGENRMLSISGEVSEESKDDKRGYARKYGSFQRSISIPASIKPDSIVGKMENGVLEVVLPKDKEHEAEHAKVQNINIQ